MAIFGDNLENIGSSGNNALKEFQTTNKIKSKSDKEFGKRVIQNITQELNGSYLRERNERFAINRRLANGKSNLDEFKKYFSPKGKVKYIHLRFKAVKIVSTAISRMVGRWMQGTEKISVKAVDPISIQKKQSEKEDIEYTMDNKPMLDELTQASGVPLVSQDQFIPQDKDELDMWAEQQHLPEEIKFEKGTNQVLKDNGWFDIIKEKVLTDAAEVGLIACEVTAKADGVIYVEWIKPESTFYSHSEYPDFRDTTYRGREKFYKIIELREEYPDLGEEQLYTISKRSSQYSQSNLTAYDSTWENSSDRPYDDWSVPVIIVYLKTSDSEISRMSVTKAGTLMVDKKATIPTEKGNNTYIKKDKYNIYKGVYVRDTEIILEWELQKNMIRSQDPQELGDCEFPLCLYMYNMHNMRNIAVPEKVEEPIDAIILTRLKIQQIVASMRPPGNAYDISTLQEINLGEGKMSVLQLKEHQNQTGDWYFSSLNEAGDRIEFPIRPQQNTEGLSQLQALIQVSNYQMDVFRSELGENENSEGQTAKPRVSAENYNTSLEVSYNNTDYMQRAYLYLMEDAGKKVGCLLKDSVEYGGKKYRKIMGEEDVKGRIFSAQAEMLPSEAEIGKVEAMVNQALQVNPAFILYCDPMLVTRIAKDNSKLASVYFRNAQKRALKGQMEQAESQSRMNSEAQTASAKSAAEGQAKLKQMEFDLAMQKLKVEGENQNKNLILTMFTQLWGKGVSVPTELIPLTSVAIQNMMIPLVADNEAQKQQIMEQMAAQQQQAQQAQEVPILEPQQQPTAQY